MESVVDPAHIIEKAQDNPDFLLLDVMPPVQYLVGHLPGAVNVPLDFLHDVMHILPKDREIVVYCTSEDCELSEVGAERLELHGFTNVTRFTGGLKAWADAGYQLEAYIDPSEIEHAHIQHGGEHE
jgi:rhodanese-related sulfurtransferase